MFGSWTLSTQMGHPLLNLGNRAPSSKLESLSITSHLVKNSPQFNSQLTSPNAHFLSPTSRSNGKYTEKWRPTCKWWQVCEEKWASWSLQGSSPDKSSHQSQIPRSCKALDHPGKIHEWMNELKRKRNNMGFVSYVW